MSKLTQEQFLSRLENLKTGVHTHGKFLTVNDSMEFYCDNGHTWITIANNVLNKGSKCPYCYGRYPIVGETDIWGTNPEVAQLLFDPEDGHKYKIGSHVELSFVCPICGNKSKHSPRNIKNRGLSCPVCGTGSSYPNKFMFNVLLQLNTKFIPEYSIYPKKFRYDFFLNEYNTIVEMHGRQHYEGWNQNNISLEEIQKNDAEKYDYAIHNGIENYIVIDSKQSEIKYLSENILASDLNKVFDLSIVDWKMCGFNANRSDIMDAALMFNDGFNIKKISSELKISYGTVIAYLHKATELGICHYDGKQERFNRRAKQVICITTGEVFNSIKEAQDKYYISNISACCKHKVNYSGKDKITGDPLIWMYLDEYSSLTIQNYNQEPERAC